MSPPVRRSLTCSTGSGNCFSDPRLLSDEALEDLIKKKIKERREGGDTTTAVESEGGSGDEGAAEESDWHASDWEWPCYDEFYNRNGDVVERRRRLLKEEEEKKDPFEVVYSNIRGIPSAERVVVEVHSENLRTVLQKLWPEKEKLRLKATYVVKGKDLFLKLDQLKECLDPETFLERQRHSGPEGVGSHAEITQVQLRHLIRFIEKEFSETAAEHERMKASGRVSFGMLWTFIKPGENVVYKCDISEEQICGKVRKAVYTPSDRSPAKWCLSLKLDVYDYNCECFSRYTRRTDLMVYDNEKPLNKLEVYPYRYLEDSAEIEERLLAQGARFGYLATSLRYRYMQFKGPLFQLRRDFYPPRIVKANADGRVMVDLFAYSKIQNDDDLGNAEPSSEVARDGRVRTVDLSEDPNRIYAPAIVYGFSFRLKRWGRFSIHGFSEVEFDGGSSWNQLVMDPDLKQITEHLVAEHLRKPAESESEHEMGIDPIANKGDGCVIICYGPPGTGKTLTAESMAEKLRAPLWSLSVSELGLSPSDLEHKLISVLEVASTWKTVLLLDEADVYLEKRTVSSDLQRNAMCGIFLRHLEYYRGVLLLTTNRVPTFDDAFRSRISVFLRYPMLTANQRETIWANLLSRAKLEEEASVIQKLVKDMAGHQLNGREIRNAIQNAQTLARAVKEPLGCKHVINATRVLAVSLATLHDHQDEDL